MLPTSTDVLIIGAGPTGLALAIALRRRGVDFVLVDKLAAGQNTSRAAVIHAHTLDVLQRIGAAAPLVEQGLALRKFSIRDRDQALIQFDFGRVPSTHKYLLMLPQHQSERLLASTLEAAGGRIFRGHEVVALSRHASGVRAEIKSPDGAQTISARYAVGADGMHSIVRQTAQIGFAGAAYAESFVLADIEMQWDHAKDDVMLFFSPDGLAVVAPLPGGSFRIVATLDNAPERPDARLIEAILRARGPQRGTTRVTSVAWSSRFHLHHRLADHYRNGPFLLMGDAAHVHSPAGGQGMNTGLVDAVVLGDALAGAINESKGDGYLDLYEATRRPAAAAVLKLAGRLTGMATMRSPLQRTIRNLGLHALDLETPAKRQLLLGLSGIGREAASHLPA